MTKTYENTGDWLEFLINNAKPVTPFDDPRTRTLGYMVDGVVHRITITTAVMTQETFQTVDQRDRILGTFQLGFSELRDLLRTPDGRAHLYSMAV